MPQMQQETLAVGFTERWEEARDLADELDRYTLSPAKERVLRAALEACNGRSIATVSARDIARAAGLNAGSLYSHYQGKSELLAAAFSWSYRRFLRYLTDNVTPSMQGDDLLRALIRSHLQHDMNFRDSGLLWRDAPDLDSSTDPTVSDLRDRVFVYPRLYRNFVASLLAEVGVTHLVNEKASIAVRMLNDVDSWNGPVTGENFDGTVNKVSGLITALNRA
ncbi:TetR/AcrR family transcriptional regulator [Corynebacterium glyciniphilum]|uniref:TetR/AcrR family transcriptional regulator n=1 Tax=Corynebacterium glyciniphilum TaxID=1404244 RepID=UPI003FD169E1